MIVGLFLLATARCSVSQDLRFHLGSVSLSKRSLWEIAAKITSRVEDSLMSGEWDPWTVEETLVILVFVFSCCVVNTHRWPKSPPLPHRPSWGSRPQGFPGPGTNAWLPSWWLPSLSLTGCFMCVRVSQRPCLTMALPGSMEEKKFPSHPLSFL